MTTPPDFDANLEALQDELRTNLAALNELHHPVYPAAPARVEQLEALVEELRGSIIARKHELRAKLPPAQRGSLEPRLEAIQTAAPAKVP
jgi:hypothetical protein